ncbi:MAG: ribbon-helix-helix domain-containing protein [Microgenomates group bacterium]
MSTVSLSLTDRQLSEIDRLSGVFGFENRSEFVRALLRVTLSDEALLKKSVAFPFDVPGEKSAKKIVGEFKETKRYSPEFLTDLKEGLEESKYFVK